MWFELDYDVALDHHARIPEHLYRRHAVDLHLAWLVDGRLRFGKDTPSVEPFAEWVAKYHPYMSPRRSDTPKRSAYSPAVIRDVKLAWKIGVFSQDALVLLGAKRLRDAGAWNQGGS